MELWGSKVFLKIWCFKFAGTNLGPSKICSFILFSHVYRKKSNCLKPDNLKFDDNQKTWSLNCFLMSDKLKKYLFKYVAKKAIISFIKMLKLNWHYVYYKSSYFKLISFTSFLKSCETFIKFLYCVRRPWPEISGDMVYSLSLFFFIKKVDCHFKKKSGCAFGS